MRYPKPAPYTGSMPFYEYEPHIMHVLRPLEEEIWSAIRLLTVEEVCLSQLRRRFRRRRRSSLAQIASKIRSCLTQAEEYYFLAVRASSRVAPLLHYYSMLNLAKALIFLEAPTRLSKPGDFLHGLSDPSRVKDARKFSLGNEVLRVQKGVFLSLHHVLAGGGIPQGTLLSPQELLEYCPAISYEWEQVTGTPSRLVMGEFNAAVDTNAKKAWLTVDLDRQAVKNCCGAVSGFASEASAFASFFTRVASPDNATLKYESQPAAHGGRGKSFFIMPGAKGLTRALRLHRFPSQSEPSSSAEYWIPLDMGGGKPLPEPCSLLAITFYLSSLVRYQPHIYDHLLGSTESWVLESFIRQCPLVYCHVMLNHLWGFEHIFCRP